MKGTAEDFDRGLGERQISCLHPVRGVLAGFSKRGEPLVDFPGNLPGQPVAAGSVVKLAPKDASREVLLTFEEGDPNRPMVIGLIQAPLPTSEIQLISPIELRVDGERIEVTAAKEIVLACGHASITLTRAGKILIRGTYLLSRSSGVHRIKGGSVQIN